MNLDGLPSIQLCKEQSESVGDENRSNEYGERLSRATSHDIQVGVKYTHSEDPLEVKEYRNTKIGTVSKLLSSKTLSEAEISDVISELLTQERIIIALQKDNKILRTENRALSVKNAEFSDYIANLEARHSFLISSVESDTQLNKNRLDTISKLTISLNELKHKFENAERCKVDLQERLNNIQLDKCKENSVSTKVAIADKVSTGESKRSHENNITDVDTAKGEVKDQINKLPNRQTVSYDLNESKEDANDIVSSKSRKANPKFNTAGDSERMLESRLLKAKSSRIRQLEEALVEKEKYIAAALKQLKDESDKLCFQNEKTISQLEAQLKNREQCEEALKKAMQHLHNMRSETKDLNIRLSKSERLLFDNNKLLKLLIKQFERRMEEMQSNFIEQLNLIYRNHSDEISRLQSLQQIELERLKKMEYSNKDIEHINRKLLKSASDKGSKGFLLAVMNCLEYLQRRCLQRDQEAIIEKAESKRIIEIERSLLVKKMALIAEQKDRQIERFRIELDELLAHLKSLSDVKILLSG